MTQAELTLVDLRAQVKAALSGMSCTVPFQVRERWNRQELSGAVVTYAEKDNRSTECSVVDELSYQIDIWAQERGEVTALCAAVNTAMLNLGLKRQEKREDVAEDGLRHCSLAFGGRVDKRFMRWID